MSTWIWYHASSSLPFPPPLPSKKTKGDLSQYEVLGVKPCGTRLEIRKGGNSAVRLPKILVLLKVLIIPRYFLRPVR